MPAARMRCKPSVMTGAGEAEAAEAFVGLDGLEQPDEVHLVEPDRGASDGVYLGEREACRKSHVREIVE